jgi:hypothetical protein
MSKPGHISVDISSLNNIPKALAGLEKEVPGAVASALNRAVDHGVTQIRKIVPTVYSIKKKEIQDAVSKVYAKKGEIKAGIRITGERLTFVHFPLTPKIPNTGRPIAVKIKNQNGKKKVSILPSAFIAPTGTKSMDKVQYNVFVRVGKKRLPIHVLRTLSIPQMVENEEVWPQIINLINNKLSERVNHEINYRLEKAAKKVKRK